MLQPLPLLRLSLLHRLSRLSESGSGSRASPNLMLAGLTEIRRARGILGLGIDNLPVRPREPLSLRRSRLRGRVLQTRMAGLDLGLLCWRLCLCLCLLPRLHLLSWLLHLLHLLTLLNRWPLLSQLPLLNRLHLLHLHPLLHRRPLRPLLPTLHPGRPRSTTLRWPRAVEDLGPDRGPRRGVAAHLVHEDRAADGEASLPERVVLPQLRRPAQPVRLLLAAGSGAACRARHCLGGRL